eukprot:scaffold20433_cov31-Tisochrysis_lutea.AAC.3
MVGGLRVHELGVMIMTTSVSEVTQMRVARGFAGMFGDRGRLGSVAGAPASARARAQLPTC